MRNFDTAVLDRLEAGEVDYIDAITAVFDSGVANFWIGGRGQFTWADTTIGTQTFYGGGALLSMELPNSALSDGSASVTVKLLEEYLPEGSDTPVNIWDNGSSPSFDIDAEPWQGREAILSVFWRDADGTILMREQVERLVMDQMVVDRDDEGRQTRSVTLERHDIIQRDIEGKTDNAEFQKQIDSTDLGYEHALYTATQTIYFGKVEDKNSN